MNKVLYIKKGKKSKKSDKGWRVFVVIMAGMLFIATALFITPPTRNIVMAQWNSLADQLVHARIVVELSKFLEQNLGYERFASDLENASESTQDSILSSDNAAGAGKAVLADNTTDGGVNDGESENSADSKSGLQSSDADNSNRDPNEGNSDTPPVTNSGGETVSGSDGQATNTDTGIKDSGASINLE
ncbi:MAG: hypothetical protein FWH55_14290, partial [Oscillospiraceae bacterium]|nr:hypothetical protein [Oscillospiraceae bacterium]